MLFSRLHTLFYPLAASAAQLLPNACILCEQAMPSGLCDDCRQRYLTHDKVRCQQCAIPIPVHPGKEDQPVCGECLRDLPAFDATITVTDYLPPIDQLIQALKFGGKLAIAPVCAQLLRDAVLEYAPARLPGYLIAVPLSKQRLAERGFNQSLQIAKPLSRALGIRLLPKAMQRTRDTAAQSSLPWNARQANLRHAFSVTPAAMEMVSGQHIGVVDDVMTTGATLDNVAATLKRFGASRVTNLIVARTLIK